MPFVKKMTENKKSKKEGCKVHHVQTGKEGDKMGKYWCYLSKASAKHKIALFPTIRHLRKSAHYHADNIYKLYSYFLPKKSFVSVPVMFEHCNYLCAQLLLLLFLWVGN